MTSRNLRTCAVTSTRKRSTYWYLCAVWLVSEEFLSPNLVVSVQDVRSLTRLAHGYVCRHPLLKQLFLNLRRMVLSVEIDVSKECCVSFFIV